MSGRGKLPALRPAWPGGAPTASIPEHFLQPGISLSQLANLLWAYRRQTALISASILVLLTAGILVLPRTYTATASLLLDYEVNDPLGGKDFPMGMLGSYIATQIDIMRSPEVLLPVVDRLHLTENRHFTAGYRQDRGTLRDWVKEGLEGSLTIEPGKGGSQLIYITAAAKTPGEAADIANTLADVHVAGQLQRINDPAGQRATRTATELAELQAKVIAAQQRVTEFRQRTGITDLAVTSDVELPLLASLEMRQQEAHNARLAAEVRSTGDQSVNAQGSGSGIIQSLKTAAAEQESRLALLQTTLGPNHPQIIELRSQLAATRQSIANEVSGYAAETGSVMGAAQELEAKIGTAVASQRARVLAVRRAQEEGGRLALELESAQGVYKRALDGYDQIVAAAGGHYSNISLVSRATLPFKATRPNRPRLFILSAALALFCGLAAPLAYELLVNRRVRGRDDLERDLGLPVLAELPATAGR